MSTFDVPDDHLDAMIGAGLRAYSRSPGAGIRWGRQRNSDAWELDEQNATRTGQMPRDQNNASMQTLYGLGTVNITRYRYCPGPALSPVEALKAIDCYEYQACETPDWDTCEAHQFCESLRRRLIQSLPGYNTANVWPLTHRHNAAS